MKDGGVNGQTVISADSAGEQAMISAGSAGEQAMISEGSVSEQAVEMESGKALADVKIEGLIPAVVQDYFTGRVLMLAYVNQESYGYMLEHGTTCFWSRSRKQLWRKGETSGNVQLIRHMAFDCDDDTLLLQVEQTGAGACHTGTYSCFGDDERGGFDIFNQVSGQIKDRELHPKEKSYTNYLLREGVDKICKKIGEEAAETIIAAKNGDKDALAEELADLSYHALVLMHTQGLTPGDIRAVLTERHGKEGNLKEKNVKGEL